jgi:hypothetical protein
MALAALGPPHTRPTDIIREQWNDAEADRIVKAAIAPVDSTMGFPSIPAWRVLPLIAPQSAAMRLLDMGITISLEGVHQINLPTVQPGGRPAPVFIGEGAPAPVVQMATSNNVLGPVKKILIITTLTSELQNVSADSAQKILSQALAYAAEMVLDSALFGSAAATAVVPQGLLHGVTPITGSAGASGLTNIADDIGDIAKAIAAAGFNTDDLVLVTNPKMAAAAHTQVGPHFDYDILSSAAIPDGEVIGLLPHALWVGYGGDDIRVEASKQVTLHMEDTAPLAIVDGSGTVASPTRSAFQQDLIALKLRGRVAWAILPGAIASVTGANW